MLETANKMIANFVNNLGLDGDYYVSVNKCPKLWGDIPSDGIFIRARSTELLAILNDLKIDPEKKKIIFNDGLIIINKKYRNIPTSMEAITTLIHETFHANRMLLINTQIANSEEINPIIFYNGKYVQTNRSVVPYYADASQEILKGSIDTSRAATSEVASLGDDELEEISFRDEIYEGKMNLQVNIDEALVEIMSLVAYLSYVKNNNNIMEIVREINAKATHEDIKAMTSIILRHNDLELFKWMISPLEYQNYDINYDFFARYITEEDKKDLQKIKDFTFVENIDDDIKKGR